MSTILTEKFQVTSPDVKYTEEAIVADYRYESTSAEIKGDTVLIRPTATKYTFKTERKVPRTGVMIVGLGGNNGSTFMAGVLANREGLTWRTKDGVKTPNYYGSLTQASTLRLGTTETGEDVYVPFKNILPMVEPNNLVIGGWDINDADMAAAMERARVLDWDLQRQLIPFMKKIKPLPSIYIPSFIAANQEGRANNLIKGTLKELLEKIRKDIRDFKAKNKVDKVIILWSANTERFADVLPGVNDTAENLMRAVEKGHTEVAPSQLFALASILEGCPYVNGSPQNTFVPGLIEFAISKGVPIGGDDFKTGQTKIKSVLVDFLVNSGIKPVSIVSYNHLGNNDGKNLSAPKQFRSKEISKSNVVDDMVAANGILYKAEEHPDHVVVIKYVPYVADSKRAMDEYTSQIFLGGHNTIVLHNTCEDSLLAVPVMIDLVIMMEILTRINWKTEEMKKFEKLHPIMSLLSFMLKAPLVPTGTPVINSLFKQRAAMENIFRACIGLAPEHNMLLSQKTRGK